MNVQIDIIAVILAVGGFVFSVATWFVTNTLGRIKDLETNQDQMDKKIALVELNNNKNNEHLVEKIGWLIDNMTELVKDVKQLNQKMK